MDTTVKTHEKKFEHNYGWVNCLVPYTGGQEFYTEAEYEFEEIEGENDEVESDEKEELIAYLPVYVETEDEDLALMAVAPPVD